MFHTESLWTELASFNNLGINPREFKYILAVECTFSNEAEE